MTSPNSNQRSQQLKDADQRQATEISLNDFTPQTLAY
jgi:hypothetical protein